MRVDRRLLYAGIFLVALGGVLLTADLGVIDTPALTNLLRLWPVAFLAIGAGLVLRRTRIGLPTGMLGVAVPGLLLGSAFAIAPRFAGDCGARAEPVSTVTEEGTFDGPATVSARSGCGSFTVTTVPGNAWRLAAGSTVGQVPSVRASSRSLSVDGSIHQGSHFFDGARDTWDLTLPTSEIAQLSLVSFANASHVALPGADIGTLALTANASDVVVDASEASVAELSGVVNVGSMSIRLPSEGDLVGSLRVGGGRLQVCSAPDNGLRVTTRGFAERVTVAGLHQTSSEWQSPDFASATHRADLTVRVNFGAVEIDPIGGCR